MSKQIGLVAPLQPIELKRGQEVAADQDLPYEVLDNGDILTDVSFMKPGTFVDSYGTEVTFTEKDLRKLARNFKANASGQDVPIDINHAYGEAAGWVREVHFKDSKLVAGVAWNAYGQSLLFNRIYRYMSATVAIPDMVLHTISLTNFPAIKGLESADTPFDIAQYADLEIEGAFFAQPLPGLALQALSGLGDVVDVAEGSVRLQVAPQVYRDLAFEQVGNTVHFSAAPTAHSTSGVSPRFSVVLGDGLAVGDDTAHEASEGGSVMLDNKEPTEGGTEETVVLAEQTTVEENIELAESGSTIIVEDEMAELAALDSEAGAELAEPEGETELTEPTPEPASAPVTNVTNVTTPVVSVTWADLPPDAKQAMFAEFSQRLEAGKDTLFAEFMTELRVEQEIVTFADKVTAHGKSVLPVKATRVAAFLRTLNAAQRAEAMALLKEIHSAGCVSLEEIGTSAPGSGRNALPAIHVTALRAHLSRGGDIGIYMRANGLNADEYDLSPFVQVK